MFKGLKMSVIEGSIKEFGNMIIFFYSLGFFCYRIEWYSWMMGVLMSLVRFKYGKYVVICKWV